MVLTVIRWLVFLPVGFVLVLILQVATSLLFVNAQWIGVLIIVFFSWPVYMAAIIPVMICPKPFAGGITLLVCFTVVEILGLIGSIGTEWMNAPVWTGRILVDLTVASGFFIGGLVGKD